MKELITRKESKRYPGLFVKKYTRKVFYDNLWNQNPELMEARGHVEDADGNIVIRPFTKIFNRFENDTDIPRDERCIVVSKVNGFMAAATYVPSVGEVVVSTTGSLDSDFVALAEKYITQRVRDIIKKDFEEVQSSMTYLFEICDPSDPHIIPEESGAYLIGCREVNDVDPFFTNVAEETFLDIMAKVMEVKRPAWDTMQFSEVVELAKNCLDEGYVVYGEKSKIALKIKSPYYLMLKAAARRKDIMALNKERVDEEFFPLVDHLKGMGDTFTLMDEQERLTYMREYLLNEMANPASAVLG